ncbi:hypothetical protein L1887_45934 [Cichorium endivia]|nr:hypothetical protein L1887_45934 [Cichorium endivia]
MCKCRSHGTFPLFGLQSSHLNICYYHQDPHRRPLRPRLTPKVCSDRRALLLIGAWHLPRRPGVGRALKRHPFSGGLVDSADERFARQYRCGPPPEFSSGFAPLRHSSPSFGVPTGMLTLEPFSEDQGRSAVHPARGIPPISFLAPCGFTHPLTRTHVRLLGPCFKTGQNGVPTGRCREHAGISPRRRVLPTNDRRDGISTSLSTARALAAAPIRTGPSPESIGGPAIAVPHPTGTHRRPPFASLPTISSTL